MKKMIIKVLWTGCPKCKLLYTTVEDAAKKLKLEYEIIKIEDMQEIAKYDVMAMPALIIDDMLVLAWWSPEPDEMLDILEDISSHEGHECCGGDCESGGWCCGWCNH